MFSLRLGTFGFPSSAEEYSSITLPSSDIAAERTDSEGDSGLGTMDGKGGKGQTALAVSEKKGGD